MPVVARFTPNGKSRVNVPGLVPDQPLCFSSARKGLSKRSMVAAGVLGLWLGKKLLKGTSKNSKS